MVGVSLGPVYFLSGNGWTKHTKHEHQLLLQFRPFLAFCNSDTKKNAYEDPLDKHDVTHSLKREFFYSHTAFK